VWWGRFTDKAGSVYANAAGCKSPNLFMVARKLAARGAFKFKELPDRDTNPFKMSASFDLENG
jgi:hypothetical protein